MAVNIAVIRFPGTNCEFDVVEVVQGLGAEAEVVFHDHQSLGQADAVVIAGGFAHGDYLRPGAIARFSPIMNAIRVFADDGGPVLGICNGFQVLTEAHMLPGALQKNSGLKFKCEMAELRVESNNSPITSRLEIGSTVRIPINHFEGNYTCSDETLAELRSEDRVVLRYQNNPNGSTDGIAGICNEARNVVGLMPHPERASHELLNSTDGLAMMQSLLDAAGVRLPTPSHT
ncbi:MAG TPA: phosphoribosylformylglycinamidine synthase subunit PurQ [Microthrixaceae bacterium]|nr:phosphoribosylformylglycinamidine synthase subunit PurQ [Microthrixaceae bacterium]